MTPAQPIGTRSAPARGLLTLFVLLVAALTATATGVAAPAALATDQPMAVTDSAATTASASGSGLAATDAVTDTGGATAGGAAAPSTAAGTAVATSAAPGTASASAPAIIDGGPSAAAGSGAGSDIRPQSPVLAAGAADTPLAHPAHYAAVPASSGGILAPPIVSTSHRHAAPLKAALTQLDSGGPLINSSGVTGAANSRAPGAQPVAPVSLRLHTGQNSQRTGAALIAVSVPIVGVFVSSQAGASAAHRDGAKSLDTTGRTRGPSGLDPTSVSPLGHGPAGQTGAAAAMFGNAPFSSGASTSPLLGLDTMLVAMLAIVAIVWCRRARDLPLLQGESALFSMALDRPG